MEAILSFLQTGGGLFSALLGAGLAGIVAIWLQYVKGKAREEGLNEALLKAAEVQNKTQSEILKNVEERQQIVQDNAAIHPDARRAR